MKLNFEELNRRYENETGVVRCDCVLATEMVGGMPADEKALRAFAIHHLQIPEGPELDAAVKRIQTQEIGERDTTPVGGELKEKKVYGVNIIRRTDFGSWIGNWMVKACIKQAASRLRIFTDIRGTKGNFAEAGRVAAIGESLKESTNPERIYAVAADGGNAQTYYSEFMGRVDTPQGPVSIIHHSECLPPGSRFSFEFRFLSAGLKEGDLADVMALAMIVGLGSAKALERGKFRIENCEIELAEQKNRKPEKPEKPKKGAIPVGAEVIAPAGMAAIAV